MTLTIQGLDKKATAKIRTRQFAFIVDGSGSMCDGLFEHAQIAELRSIKNLSEKAGTYPANHEVFIEGTDLTPSLRRLGDEIDPSKTCHAVILSDGDTFDNEKAAIELEQLKNKSPKLTIDVVVMKLPNEQNERKTNLEKLFENASRTNLIVSNTSDCTSTVESILAYRLREVRSRGQRELAI